MTALLRASDEGSSLKDDVHKYRGPIRAKGSYTSWNGQEPEHTIDVIAIQETHRCRESRKPKIEGMKLIIDRPHEKYGSAILVKLNVEVIS